MVLPKKKQMLLKEKKAKTKQNHLYTHIQTNKSYKKKKTTQTKANQTKNFKHVAAFQPDFKDISSWWIVTLLKEIFIQIGSPVCQKTTCMGIVTLSEALFTSTYIWANEIDFTFQVKKAGICKQEYQGS